MCAHAVRVAVERMDGVLGVEVSLNEGFADITLAESNAVELQSIREVVRNNGFSPREAQILIRGVVSLRNQTAFLDVASSGESFRLTGKEDVLATLTHQGEVILEGVVPRSENVDETSTLRVTGSVPR